KVRSIATAKRMTVTVKFSRKSRANCHRSSSSAVRITGVAAVAIPFENTSQLCVFVECKKSRRSRVATETFFLLLQEGFEGITAVVRRLFSFIELHPANESLACHLCQDGVSAQLSRVVAIRDEPDTTVGFCVGNDQLCLH